jgi:hypothetical protein
MRFVSTVLFVGFFLYSNIANAQQTPENIQSIVDTMIRLCLGGGYTQATVGSGSGGANISLRSLDVKGNVQGEFKVSRANAEGLVNGIDNALSQIAANEADKVRECLQPVRERVLDILLPVPRCSTAPQNTTQLPDVSLRFVFPKSPSLLVINNGDAVASNIKWAVILWNTNLPDRDDPLPIPISTFDWLKPHTVGGPEDIFRTGLVQPLLKPGDHLLGSAEVDCPACPRERAYAVSIVWGEGGWFSELKDVKSGIVAPSNFTKPTRIQFWSALEAVPAQSRLAIGDYVKP